MFVIVHPLYCTAYNYQLSYGIYSVWVVLVHFRQSASLHAYTIHANAIYSNSLQQSERGNNLQINN